MPYQIFDIRKTNPDAYPLYFLDANVWIYSFTASLVLNVYQKAYVNFVSQIILLHTSNSAVKPKLVLLAQSLSEVINRTLRSGWQEFNEIQRQSGHSTLEYKDYRNTTTHFLTTLQRVCTDFDDRKDYIEVMDDDFKSMKPFVDLLPSLSVQVDFNDLYFAQLMRKHNIPIVTNDGDFVFEDVPIITCNKTLLTL